MFNGVGRDTLVPADEVFAHEGGPLSSSSSDRVRRTDERKRRHKQSFQSRGQLRPRRFRQLLQATEPKDNMDGILGF